MLPPAAPVSVMPVALPWTSWLGPIVAVVIGGAGDAGGVAGGAGDAGVDALDVDAVGQRDPDATDGAVADVRVAGRSGFPGWRRRGLGAGAGAGAAGVDGEPERFAPQPLVGLEDDAAARRAVIGAALSTPRKMMSPAPSRPSAVPPVVSGARELNGLWERPPWPAGGAAASTSTYQTTGPNDLDRDGGGVGLVGRRLGVVVVDGVGERVGAGEAGGRVVGEGAVGC